MPSSLAQPVRDVDIPDVLRLYLFDTLILEHSVTGLARVKLLRLVREAIVPCVNAHVFALNLKTCLGHLGFDDEVVVAVRAVLVALLKLLGVLAEALLALLARKRHFGGLGKRVVLGFGMAFGTVEPLLAAGTADRDLGVEDVLAAAERRRSAAANRGRGEQAVTYHMATVVTGVCGPVRRLRRASRAQRAT